MNIHRIYGWISPPFRRHRLGRMRQALGPISTLLDVGGYPWCWTDWPGTRPEITLLNLDRRAVAQTEAAGYAFVVGDGCSLPFRDRTFDVLFSNSVIEHVGSWPRQCAFAAEARRVGRRLWIQTPAREFFIEPHLLAPFIHWLPSGWQRRLIRNFTLRGWLDRPDREEIDRLLASVRLLTSSEMQELFPDCMILHERFLGLTKSYIAVRR